MNQTVLKLINPVEWIKAYNFHKRNATYDKSSFDLELYLYSNILRNDMLHYGYFENTEILADEISIKQFEQAQIKYADNIIDQVKDSSSLVLDVGCGMGGLSYRLAQRGMQVEALTPNTNQKLHINSKYPDIRVHHCKFEDIVTNEHYGTIINSESLQYIDMTKAFELVSSLLKPGGRWVIVDYFRLNTDGINHSGHRLEDFIQRIDSNGFKIVYEQDITRNVLPTIQLVNMYAERFLTPLKHFGFEKLRYKKAWLYYLLSDLRKNIDTKINKELASVNPEMFLKEKKYLMFVLEQK